MRQFTDEQRNVIAQMYERGVRSRDIAAVFHCAKIAILRVLREERVHIRRPVPAHLPSPSEIRRETRRIQETWDEEERERRASSESRVPWMPRW